MVMKTPSNFDFDKIEFCMGMMSKDHSSNILSKLKSELNIFFKKVPCRDILYTNNTDKLFFGMRVYPIINSDNIIDVIRDDESINFSGYYLELDSKLFDPMLDLTDKELTSILLHEIGHIVYDTATIDEVKKQIDMYLAASDDYISTIGYSKGYKEVLAYAMKDSVIKVGSLFSKIGNTEIIADTFVASCGYGPELNSALRKISRSTFYLNKNVDNRLLAMSWALRLKNEFNTSRIPAIKTLNKAKQLTASKLEERELSFAVNAVNRMENPMNESIIDNMKSRFSKKINDFKIKGIRGIKNDVYELNVRLRCAESEEDLLYIIRTLNSDIAILKDYLTEDIPDDEREEIFKTLQDMYDIRENAAKKKDIQKSDTLITVVYPNM